MNTENIQELTDFLNEYDVEFTIENNTVIADTINLYNNELTSLPESFGNLKCDSINLSVNELTSLPESFGNLKCNEIHLDNNNLTSLPESFGNLKCYVIILYNNKLTGLPESFANLKCNEIHLDNNNLTSLPESFGNLKCNRINLYNNELTTLPESFDNLKCNEIHLDNNKLRSLPESFGNLKCNKIILNNNELTSLPESFGNLKCNKIILDNNKLTGLPESFGNLKCNSINLYNNKLTSLPYIKPFFDEVEITDEYIYCDGILTWFDKIKQIGDYIVYCGYFNNYVVSYNDTFAHGNSIRQCINDIYFKLSERDCKQYKDYTLDTELSLVDATVMYRHITGACSGGIESFLQSLKNVHDTYTVKDIIKVTENHFGDEGFKSFFDE